MGKFSGRYVVRYGWTRAGVSLFAATTAFVAVGFLPPMQSPGTDHIELVFSPFALWIMTVCTSRRKAFRVDKQGVTLYRSLPFRTPLFVPWADVLAVDWSSERRFWGAHTKLTVLRHRTPRAGVTPLLTPEREEVGTSPAPDSDPFGLPPFPHTTTIERDTTFSRVDPVRLATALDALAPAVRHFGDLGDLAIRRADITAAARELNPQPPGSVLDRPAVEPRPRPNGLDAV